jgi:hypothetical protein
MSRPSHDPSIENEPHLQGKAPRPDPSEKKATKALRSASRNRYSEEEIAEHNVWDEPGVSAKPPPSALTYSEWIERRRAETHWIHTWILTFCIAIVAGPFAIVTALFGSGQTFFSILAIVLFAPLVEEIGKVAVALWAVEKRPFYFRSGLQIAICAAAGGLAFAVIENLLYLHVKIENPSAAIIQWRWTVCVALHVTCSLIASLGLIRIWRDAWTRRARPRLSLASPFLIAAMVVHGLYNGTVLILDLGGFGF